MVENQVVYEDLIKRIKGTSLLALPQSAARVLELSKNPANGPPEYAIPISADVGLTSQILKFVNSSFFGFRYKITTVQMALSLVHVRTIKNFVLWNAVFALLPNPKCGPFDLKVLCQDSLRRAGFAKIFGAYFQELDAENLFVAALLQDMAIPILAQFWPEEYKSILIRHQEEGISISALEQDIFGWNHADAGAYLVREWGFGEELAQSIAAHTIRGKTSETMKTEDAIIALSSQLPSVMEQDWKAADVFFADFHKLQRKGIPSPGVLFATLDEVFSDLSNISQMGQPPISVVELHRRYIASVSE